MQDRKDNQIASYALLDGRLGLYVGDITEHATDAIVNAANSSLLGGGGVDGAIHQTRACQKIRETTHPNGLPTGEVVITTGGCLPARYVIHTVGPFYGRHNGREAELLAACYRNALTLARQHTLSKVAFPMISTGVYGYPLTEAAQVVFKTLESCLSEDDFFKEVRLVFYRDAVLREFLAAVRTVG